MGTQISSHNLITEFILRMIRQEHHLRTYKFKFMYNMQVKLHYVGYTSDYVEIGGSRKVCAYPINEINSILTRQKNIISLL